MKRGERFEAPRPMFMRQDIHCVFIASPSPVKQAAKGSVKRPNFIRQAMRGEAMREEAMRGEAMRREAMPGEAMRGEAMRGEQMRRKRTSG